MESVPLPLLAVGLDHHVIAVNSSGAQLLGRDAVGRHYIAALRQPELLRGIESVLSKRRAKTARYVQRGGVRDVVYDVQISPVDDGVILAFQDRSHTDEAVQSRRDFVANVSHELRTPLTALSGFIETLQGAAKDDPNARQQFLEIMEREAGRMTRLVDDLLSLSRVEQDLRVRPKDRVQVGGVVLATLNEMAPLLQDVTVAHDGLENETEVLGDVRQLRQVVGNLLENAVKYGGRDATVRLVLTGPHHVPALRSDALVLAISDTGEGIADHHLPRLTERFYRVDTHRSRAIGGTGLGLAIVKHIVNRHRGRMDIQSELGVGTTVSISLPIA